MRTTVRVHRLAEHSLLAWSRSLAADPAEAFGLAETFYSAVEAELVRTNGRPDRSFSVPRISPETRAWDFQARRYWIVYVVWEQATGWWRRLMHGKAREVVILGFQDRAPTRADLERLTTARNRPR
jgi:hypothetical protein